MSLQARIAALISAIGADIKKLFSEKQHSLHGGKVSRWNAAGNGTTVPGVDGFIAWTAAGTPTARSVATTNTASRMQRIGYISASTAGSMVSIRTAAGQFTTGDGAGNGGFLFSFRGFINDPVGVIGSRGFIGMRAATTAPTNVDPSTQVNSIGFLKSDADRNLMFMCKGSGSTVYGNPLMEWWPESSATQGSPFELAFWCLPDENGVVHWSVENLETGAFASGTVTPTTPGVETPLSTTLLNPVVWRSNNTSAAVVGFDVSSVYIETDL